MTIQLRQKDKALTLLHAMMSWQCGFEIKNQQSTFQTADVPSELDLNGIVLRTHRQPRNNGPATVLLCMYEILCIVVLVAIKEGGGVVAARDWNWWDQRQIGSRNQINREPVERQTTQLQVTNERIEATARGVEGLMGRWGNSRGRIDVHS